jgi:hypothetical protein
MRPYQVYLNVDKAFDIEWDKDVLYKLTIINLLS